MTLDVSKTTSNRQGITKSLRLDEELPDGYTSGAKSAYSFGVPEL